MTNLVAVVAVVLGSQQLKCGNSDINTLVRDNLFNEVVRCDRASDAAWTACRTPEELKARQVQVRKDVMSAIGGFPERTPLNARVTGRIRRDGYVIEKILFESRPAHYVTAHLFLPDDPKFKAPYPGVVSPCGHSIAGKNAPWYQRVGVTGARHGLATLVFDPVDQGERRQIPSGQNWVGSVTGHNRTGYRATLLGWNTAQFRIWDGIRACDYLASRPEVDASRLGVTGLSGGGTLSSYLNALDDRYKAGAPAGFLSTMRDTYANIGGQDAEQFFFGQAKFGFNHLGIMVLRAPSPVMLVATHADYFPFMGSLATIERARSVYSVFGAADRVDLMETSGPHNWYESTRNAAMLWIRRWTANDSSAWPCDRAALRRLDPGFEYNASNSGLAYEKPEVRNVTKTGRVLDIPGARSVYDLMKDELARVDKNRPKTTGERVRAAAGVRPLSALSATPIYVREKQATDGRAVSLLLSRDDDLVPIPMRVFIPAKTKGDPVMLVSDSSAKGLADEVCGLISGGRAVAVAELRGFGQTARGRHRFYGAGRPDEEMAVMAISVGENLASLRAEDAALAARHLCGLTGSQRVALVASGAAAIPAAHAYALERQLFSSCEVKRRPPSWHDVVNNPQTPFAFADVVHGALRVYDWTDLLASPLSTR